MRVSNFDDAKKHRGDPFGTWLDYYERIMRVSNFDDAKKHRGTHLELGLIITSE